MPKTKETKDKKTRAAKRRMTGVVVVDSKDKTIRVKVSRMVVHPKYRKRYVSHTDYLVHDPKNQYKVGDKVVFEECRPISKHKRWRVLY